MSSDINDHLGAGPLELETPINFNGINARSGGYLFEPLSSQQLADAATGKLFAQKPHDKGYEAELRYRREESGKAHWGVKEGVDVGKLEQTGWGVIFPAVARGSEAEGRQAAIREALSPLLALRKGQATGLHEHYYKEYTGALAYRPGESKQKYLARLGTGPGPADPDKVPYYLLIVGSPEEIPFQFQYQLDVQYAVGRLHFDTLDDYNSYARSVVTAETGELSLSRELAFVGVANPDDMATLLSRKHLVAPLADLAEASKGAPGWTVSRYFDERANKAHVSELLGGAKTPALLFTASHGMGFPHGDPLQRRHQGALLLQDWPGPREWSGAIDEGQYFSGDDLSSDANLLGLIAFNFACYGGGTPRYDEFSKQAFKERKEIAEQAFVAELPRRMLAHPCGGALASIGHIERAWGYSFMWGTGPRGAASPQLTVFESTLEALMKGMPVGAALDHFNLRYAEMASDLALQLEELEFDPDACDAYTLANMWTSSNDARGYAITGDPAVRLAIASSEDEGQGRGRKHIELVSGSALAASALESASSAVPAAEAETEMPGPASAPEEVASFGLFGGRSDTSEAPADDAPAQGTFGRFIDKAVSALGDMLEDVTTVEVRTYVSDNPSVAADPDQADLAVAAELRAFTRMAIDGDTEIIIPTRDGVLDTELWELHCETVKQAQEARTQTLQTLISVLSGLVKL